jgi:hypothetical protein
MRARSFIRQILLLAVLSALAQAQVVVTDDANTSSLYPTKNFGSSIALLVGSGSNSYIKFSLANLGPAITGSNVSKATLILYTDFVLIAGTMDVYQVSGSWSEGKITWNNVPALGTKLFSAVSVSSTGYLSLDMTSTVQAWLNGTLANNGIALVPSSGSSISVSFDSKENLFTSHTADLSLVLVSAGPQGPQGPQGTTGAQGPAGPVGPAGPQGAQGVQGPIGLTGATGPQGPAGPAGTNGTGFTFRNAFNPKPSYNVNDVVTYNGSSYAAIAASSGPNNPTPDTNPAAWSVMAAQGSTGPAGSPGTQGPQGSQGPQGATGSQGSAGPQGPQGPAGPAGPKGDTGAVGAQGPPGTQGPVGSFPSNFRGGSSGGATGNFTVPNGVTTLQIEVVGGGGSGDSVQGGGGGSGAYQKVVLSVTPGETYSYYLGTGGGSGGSQTTTVKDQNGNVVACGAGGMQGLGTTGGLGGQFSISCLSLEGLLLVNSVIIDGQMGQFGQIYPVVVNGIVGNTITVPGSGGAPVMLGAGAGGPGGPNSNGLQPPAPLPGYVLFSW